MVNYMGVVLVLEVIGTYLSRPDLPSIHLDGHNNLYVLPGQLPGKMYCGYAVSDEVLTMNWTSRQDEIMAQCPFNVEEEGRRLVEELKALLNDSENMSCMFPRRRVSSKPWGEKNKYSIMAMWVRVGDNAYWHED